MKLSDITGSRIVAVALLTSLWTLACSSDEGDDTQGSGGSSMSTGGKASTTGGKSSTSTTAAKTGGAPATGGAANTGGAPGTSSTALTGGAPSTGGVAGTATGGVASTATGGVASTATGGVNSTGTTAAVGGAGVGGVTGTGGGTGTTEIDAGQTDGGIACDGCITLFVPLAAEKTGTDFEVDFGATPVDLSTSILTARVYVETTGNAGGLRLYAKNDTSYASVYSTWANLGDLKDGWHEITLDLAATAALEDGGTGFDKSKVKWVGFNLSAGDTYSGASFKDVTVYVDSITFSDDAHPNFTFDGNALDGFSINKYNTPVAGSLLNGVPSSG